MKIPYRLLCFLWIFCCLTFTVNRARADNGKKEENLFLDPIIVSASRSQMPSSRVADQTETLTAEDIQTLPAQNLSEVLNYMPGVDIQNNGPFGQASSVSLRGASSRQVLVMVDGIPFNTQLSGQANLSRIPIEDIQQIDVIQGGDSSVWGSSLGGVINVITKPAGTSAQPKGHFTTDFAQFATSKNSLDVEGKKGNLGFYTFGSFLHADGNLADSRTEEIKTFTKFNYDFNQTISLTGSFGYSGADLRYGPTPGHRIFAQPYISRYGSIGLHADQSPHQWNLLYKYNDQDITADSYNSTTGARVSSTVSRDFYQGLSLNDVYEISADYQLTAGVDSDWHVLKSNNYLAQSKSINSQAPYANLTWHAGNWDFIPGLRYDENSRFGDQLSPSFGAVYHFSSWEGGLIRAKAARVFNAPPLLWLYNNDPSFLVAPNPDLKAERAFLYEIGTEGPLLKGLKGQLNLYRSEVKDAIAVILNNSGLFESRNFQKFIRQGGEARLDYAWNKRASLFAAADFNDVKNSQTKTIVRDAGIARESFKWGASYQWPMGLTCHLQGYYNRFSSSPAQANDRKPIFDVKLTQDFKNISKNTDLEIFFNIHNLTNSQYWSDPNYPLAGRYVEGGATVSF